MNAKEYRHPKEKTYFVIALLLAALFHFCTAGFLFIIYILLLIPFWITEQFFKVTVLGDSIRIKKTQYSKIYDMIEKQCNELNIKKIPELYIFNGQGINNAFAIRYISTKYIILLSSLVDLMLNRKAESELEFIIGHELAHHALGHTSAFKTLILLPSMYIPFIGTAYKRSCEYSADRIGFELTKKNKQAIRGLLSLTTGSEALSDNTDINEFAKQEELISPIFGFLSNLGDSHPRMTKRIRELLPLWNNISNKNIIKEQTDKLIDHENKQEIRK